MQNQNLMKRKVNPSGNCYKKENRKENRKKEHFLFILSIRHATKEKNSVKISLKKKKATPLIIPKLKYKYTHNHNKKLKIKKNYSQLKIQIHT